MNKACRIFALLFSATLLLCALAYCAEPLNDWEKGVFHDVIEQWHEMLYAKTYATNLTKDDFDTMFRTVANKYNIGVDRVKDIDDRGLAASDVSDKDYEIYDALGAKLKAANTVDDARRVHMDIVNQYGITLPRLHEIEYYMEEGMWNW